MPATANSELNFTEVWDRICLLTGWRTYGSMAEFLEITSSSVSGAKKREIMPIEWAYKVARGFGGSTDWVLIGKGPMLLDENANSIEVPGQSSEGLGKEYVRVPRYEVAASAGGGAFVESEQIVDYLSFRSEWVRNTLGVSVKDLALINVIGDSMEPTLSDGDVVLLDMTFRGVQDSSIYVLQLNGTLLVKRIQHKLNGSLEIISDNSLYKSEIVTGDEVNQLKIVGRVIWAGRRM